MSGNGELRLTTSTLMEPGDVRGKRHCGDCGTEVFGKCHFCALCATRRNTDRQRVRRQQDAAKRLAEGWQDGRAKRLAGDITDDDVEAWNNVRPAVPRVEYEPTPLSIPLAAQAVEQAVSQSIKISGVLNPIGSKPWDVKVREVLDQAKASGCSNAEIDEAIQTGILRAGRTFRLPADARVPGYILAGEYTEYMPNGPHQVAV
jgi:hypothetical protein